MSDLEAVLARREARQHRQTMFMAKHPLVIGFTVVTPGPIKSSPRVETIFSAGLEAVLGVLSAHGWEILDSEKIHEETGPEWMAVVKAPAGELKRSLCELEDNEPLGRLWDLDVIVPAGPLSRSEFDLSPRKCLVCESEAHACARSRAHDLEELDAVIVSMMGQ